MKMRKQTLAAVLLIFSCVLACQSFAAQSFDGQKIISIGTGWASEGIYVTTAASNISTEGCGPRFLIDPTHPMLKEMTTILLSAYHTNSKVNLYVDGCIGSGVMNLESVAIEK